MTCSHKLIQKIHYTQCTCIVTEHVMHVYLANIIIPEDAHPGGVTTSQTTLCRNFGGKEWGGVLSKGAY